MALPLIAAGLGSVISTEAALGGRILGAELLEFAGRMFGESFETTMSGLKEAPTEIRIPVSSSAIRSIGYKVGGIITVEFKRGGSGTYEYIGSEEVFMAFAVAPSKGAFFNQHFR